MLKNMLFLILAMWHLAHTGYAKFEDMELFEVLDYPDYISQLDPAPPDLIHEVVIAVVQQNLELIENILTERSTPGNPKYRQWLTFEEVSAITQNTSAFIEVMAWLDSSDATVTNITTYGHYITAEAPISTWSHMLNAEFYEYKNDLDDTRIIRALSYSVPVNVSDSIESIFGVSHMIPQISSYGQIRPYEQSHAIGTNTTRNQIHMQLSSHTDILHNLRNLRGTFRGENIHSRTSHNNDPNYSPGNSPESEFTTMGNSGVTAPYLDQYYQVPLTQGSTDFKQSIFSTGNNYYSQEDVSTLLNSINNPYQTVENIGGYQSSSADCNGKNSCDEGNLDLQYIMGMAQKTSTVFWHVNTFKNPFLQYILDVASTPNPPLVHSISFGSIEQNTPASIMDQFNLEAMKLGAMGVTIFVSSGDDGVANVGCRCDASQPTTISNCACQLNSGSSASNWKGTSKWSGNGYFPSFPATSPYVTAVGATMGSRNVVPNLDEGERACQSQFGGVITTGGGFSTYYPRPSWQNDAVTNYFSTVTPKPTSGYNPNGRGYPDVALLGVSYEVIIHGSIYGTYGTSASAPVMAAFITLLNTLRLQQNQSAIGFLNPTLYALGANYFRDITSGTNNCCIGGDTCCTSGFTATPGWDPLTGLGSIYFNNLAAMVGTNSTPYKFPPPEPDHLSIYGLKIPINTLIYIGIGVAVLLIVLVVLCLCWPKYRARRKVLHPKVMIVQSGFQSPSKFNMDDVYAVKTDISGIGSSKQIRK